MNDEQLWETTMDPTKRTLIQVLIGEDGDAENKMEILMGDDVEPRREWIENIVEQCRKYNIPVFMKPSLTDIWGEELIQEFPKALIHA